MSILERSLGLRSSSEEGADFLPHSFQDSSSSSSTTSSRSSVMWIFPSANMRDEVKRSRRRSKGKREENGVMWFWSQMKKKM